MADLIQGPQPRVGTISTGNCMTPISERNDAYFSSVDGLLPELPHPDDKTTNGINKSPIRVLLIIPFTNIKYFEL